MVYRYRYLSLVHTPEERLPSSCDLSVLFASHSVYFSFPKGTSVSKVKPSHLKGAQASVRGGAGYSPRAGEPASPRARNPPATHPQPTRNPPATHPQPTRNPPATHPQPTCPARGVGPLCVAFCESMTKASGCLFDKRHFACIFLSASNPARYPARYPARCPHFVYPIRAPFS